MNITDKTGRKLKIGQLTDVFCIGMFRGKIMDIKEAPMILSSTQQIRPHIVVQVIITPFVGPDGSVQDVYITDEPNPNDPVVKQAKGLIEKP